MTTNIVFSFISLTSITWFQFFVFFAIASIVWIIWVYKDVILGKGQPPNTNNGQPPADAKRVWSVNDPNERYQPQSISDNHRPVYRQDNQQGYDEEDLDEQTDNEQEEDGEPESEYVELEQLATEIAALLSSSQHIKDENELLGKIRPLIQQHPNLNRPAFKATIHHLIERGAYAECGLNINSTQTEALWQ